MTNVDPLTLPATGNGAMDTAHRRLFLDLQRLATAPPSRFAPAFHATVASLEHEFRAEEDTLEAIGFPGIACHREQHARALAGLHHAAAVLDQGHAPPAQRAVRLLQHWLMVHIGTMDTVAAVAIELAAAARRQD